ncbi:hypothetical protein [Nevskia sp.]|uniref:hypothetical protein n=1 Tax=Nevskia sp. TaxID=1929292 RepID=UPI0025D133E9|nr:hypothetical protein [Nevskia sp.]
MNPFFTSGLAVDLVLALMAGEALVLLAVHRYAGRGPAPSDWLANLASGFCLVLGIRAVVAGLSWPWLALALSGSLAAHLVDLKLRWR